MNYRDVAQKLRTKAADKAVGPEEREALLAKATELEGKVGAPSERVTVTYLYIPKDQTKPVTVSMVIDPFPLDWYITMEQWGDTSDWYSGAEY